MLITFTGAQSTGKTTLLESLEESNKHDESVIFVPEVTRMIKRLYGIPINEEASVMTQLQITCEHYRNAFKKESDSVRLKVLDRCALDGAIYSRYFANERQFGSMRTVGVDINNDFSTEWEYAAQQSKRYLPDMMSKYDVIFYTDPRDVMLVDDGERSASVYFRDKIIEAFAQELQTYENIIVLSGTVEERLKTIQATLNDRGCSIEIK